MTGDKYELKVTIEVSCENCWGNHGHKRPGQIVPQQVYMQIQDDHENGHSVYRCPNCGATVMVEVSVRN